jgi:hypothetical protein
MPACDSLRRERWRARHDRLIATGRAGRVGFALASPPACDFVTESELFADAGPRHAAGATKPQQVSAVELR